MGAWIGGSILSVMLQMAIGDSGRIIFALALVIFWLLLQIKRLRDANRSLAWMLLNLLTPFIALIVIGCFPSNHENNKWVE